MPILLWNGSLHLKAWRGRLVERKVYFLKFRRSIVLVLTLLLNVKSLHWWCGTCQWRIV
jgi:hypothetical protein